MRMLFACFFLIFVYATGAFAGEYEICGKKKVSQGDLLVQRLIDGEICWSIERNRKIEKNNLYLPRDRVNIAYIFEIVDNDRIDYDPIVNIKKKIPTIDGEKSTDYIVLVRKVIKTLCERKEYIDLSTLQKDGLRVKAISYNRYHVGISGPSRSIRKFHIKFKPKSRECEITTDEGLRETFVVDDIGEPGPGLVVGILESLFGTPPAIAGNARKYADIEVEIAKGRVVNGLVIANWSASYRTGGSIEVRDLSIRDQGRLFSALFRQFE